MGTETSGSDGFARSADGTCADGGRRRRSWPDRGASVTNGLVGIAGATALALVLMLVLAGEARATPPVIQSVRSVTYQQLTVTFSDPVYTATSSGVGAGDLVPADFTVTDTACAGPVAGVTGVAKVSQSVWTLTLDRDACPHDTAINVATGAAFNAGGEPITAQAEDVPFTAAHLSSLLTAFTGIDVPLDSFDAPLVGDWFEHEVADVPTARDITDLIPGLTDVAATTEDQLTDALEALPGITDVAFSGTGVDLTFSSTDLGTADAFHQAGTVGIPGLDFEVTGEVDGQLAFGGTLGLVLTPAGAEVIETDLSLAVDVAGTISGMTGRLGFVDVTVPTASLTLQGTADVSLDCPAAATSCAPGDLVTTVVPGGSAVLALPTVSIAQGGGTPFVIGDGSPNAVDVTWALPDLESPTVGGGFEDYELANFTDVSFSQVVAGLTFVSGWLQEVEQHDAMAVELPVVGGTLGELTQASAQMRAKLDGPDGLLAKVEALTEDVSAQDAVQLLCEADLLPLTEAQCATALDPLSISSDAIEYQFSLDLPATLFGTGGAFPDPAIDLALGDDLAGLSLSAQTGTWDGDSTIAVDLTLGLKISSNEDLAEELGYDTPGDLDEDGTADATDTDDDGDSVPETDTLAAGDLCEGLAASLHLSATDLRHVNDDLTVAQCDAKVATGASVNTEPGDATPETLTDATACLALAQVHGIGVSAFMEMNAYADEAACALAVSSTGTYVYDLEITPVSVAHRIYAVVGDDPVIDAGLTITGTDVGVGATLGFLDLRLAGDVSVDPGVTVSLVDPETSAADGKVDLAELAEAADEDQVGDVIDLSLSGRLEAHFTLTNNILPSLEADLDVVGAVSALNNDAEDLFTFHDTALDGPLDDDVEPDTINVGHTLGDLLDVKDLSPVDVVRMVLDFSEQMGALAGDEIMATEIPFVGMTAQDMVSFTRSLTDTAEAVVERDPQTLGAFGDALNDALQDAGFPADLTVGVTGDELTISFDASRSVYASYPFNFALPDIPLLQVDGGALLGAGAAVAFEPEIGILFDGSGLADRIFVRNATPTFTASADASVNGAVSLGPLSTAINGELAIDAEVAVELNEDADSDGDGRFTIAELEDGFDDGDLIDVAFSGPFSAHLDIATPEAFVNIDGDLSAPGDVTIEHNIDLSLIKLDLGTLVTGVTESAKFIGRALQQSDALSTELPLLGDGLTGLVSVGEDIEALAAEIRSLWDEAAANSEQFLEGLEGDIEGFLGCSDCVDITLTDSDGEPTTDLGDAAGILVSLTLAGEETVTTPLSGGIDLSPVFELDASLSPTVTYGYAMHLGLGLSIDKGFYLAEGDLLEMYARLDTGDSINVPVRIGGLDVAGIVDGSAAIGGTLGPDGNAAGFKVSLPDDLSYRDVANRRKSPDNLIEAEFSLDADLDLPIDTTFTDAPNLHVPVKLSWEASGNLTDGADIGDPVLTLGDADDPILLDAQSFVSNVVVPILEQANTYNPLSQVPQIKDTLDTEIPVLESTVRQLVKLAVGNQPAWKVFEFLVDMEDVIETLWEPGAGLIEVGWVEVLPSYEVHRAATPWYDQEAGDALGDVLDSLNTTAGGTGTVKAPKPAQPVPPTALSPGKMFTFPILDDPMAAVGMILGGDFSETVSFLEFRAPPLNIGPQIHWSQTLFDLNIGFVSGSISLQVDGYFGLEVRLGFGYDSTGLQPGRSPLDGVYLVDFKDDQHDLKEIAVGGRISGTINGRFAIAGDLASASFRGSAGVELSAGIDFNDESKAIPAVERGDGKFHLYEIAQVATASVIPGQPKELAMLLCPFRPAVSFTAYLQLQAKAKVLGITVFDESYSDSWTLVDWALECALETKIAKLVDGQLILNAGPQHAQDRFDGEGDVAEGFSLTPIDGGANIQVAWTGAGSKPALTFPASQINQIYGELGTGADRVVIDPGISIPAVLIGGAGDDVLEGGSGADQVQGNADADTLKGGAGGDALDGGAGDDGLTGGAGTDDLQGGDGDDTYTFASGWGDDVIDDAVGTDTATFATVGQALTGTSSFGEAKVTDGTNRLTYQADQIDVLHSGTGADTYTLAPDMPDGFSLDTDGGADTVNAPMSGQTRTLHVTDSGSETTDRLKVFGTPGRDTFLLRATTADLTTLPTDGFVAMLAPGDLVDRIDYDHSLDALELDTDAGRDKVALDDVAVPATVRGAAGTDTFQVGQIFEHPRDAAHGIAAADVFATADTTRGRLSKGISYTTTIDGGTEGDLFNVYSNRGELSLLGGDGDDTFVLRAFVEAGSLVMSGEAGTDEFRVEQFDYVANNNVTIDGGAGNDTVVLVGTELDDGFLISSDGVRICKINSTTALPDPAECAVNATYSNVESLLGQGLEGDDVFQVLSTSPSVATAIFGSENSDTFVVGDDGDVTGIQGPLRISGEADPDVDTSIPAPVVLPGEDADGSIEPAITGGTNVGDTLRIDASDDASGNTGALADGSVTGLGMGTGATIGTTTYPGGVLYAQIEFVEVQLDGQADTFDVVSTHQVDEDPATVRTTVRGGAGGDTINVRRISDTTSADGEGGDDTVNVGSLAPAADGTVHGIGALLDVVGGAGANDRLFVDDTGDPSDNALTSVQGRITGMGLSSEGVTHGTIELLDVSFGAGDDVANVRGTSTATTLHGNDGDERVYVSDAADRTPATDTDHLLGTLDDVDGALTIDAGAGRHTLMVSDEASTTGDGTEATPAVLDEGSITGLSTGPIAYDADGTFAGGITVWSSQGADVFRVDGTRRDAGVLTITTLNSNEGADMVAAALESATDGFADVNLEEGDDAFDATGHTLPLVVFGGLGEDDLTTGTGGDIVFGDIGRVEYDVAEAPVTVLGGGGPGDKTDGVDRVVSSIRSHGMDGSDDSIAAGSGDDVVIGGAEADDIDAGDGANLVLGDHGSRDGAVVESSDAANGGVDTIDTGADADIVFGGTDADVIGSGGGNDVVLGGHGRRDPSESDLRTRTLTRFADDATADTGDTIAAGDGDDWVMGQQGTDGIDAGAGDDTVIGGHNAAASLDAGDTVRAGAGVDTVLGDNALAWPGLTTELLDPTTIGAGSTSSGGDHLAGEGDDDTLYGQGADDRVFGGDAHDTIEGNQANDCLMGGGGQDNIVGGGSALDGRIVPGRTGNGLPDGIDTIHGDGVEPTAAGDLLACMPGSSAAGAADVLSGDNARILWSMTGATHALNAFDASFVRTVVLFDVERPSAPAAAGVRGTDTLQGGGGNDWIFGQGATDTLGGDDGDDYLEGGHAADTIDGGPGQDDVVGGSSTASGAFRAASPPAGLSDGNDTIHGDGDADVVLADNGAITRAVLGSGAWKTLGDQNGNVSADLQTIVVRSTATSATPEVAGAFGSDTVFGDAGADELIGQQGDDTVQGGDGADAIVGDLGKITTTLENGGRAATPRTNQPFMTSPIHQLGTLTRQVQLYSFLDTNGAVGVDTLLGGAGSDAVHGGPGADIINGNGGDDYLFGGTGGDALWGGPDNDDLFGGYGRDYLDVVPRPADPQAWHTHATVDHLQGFDLLYGGFDADALQADFQQNGPGIADRLVDWSGVFNAYFVCNGGGAGTIIRSADPATIAYLQAVAEGRGAHQVKTPTSSSGFDEAAIVFTADIKKNNSPAHSDGRGMGVCPPP